MNPRWRTFTATAALLAALSAPASAKTKLVMATHFEGAQHVMLEQFAKEYMALHPDVEIELRTIPLLNPEDYLEKISVAHAAGVPADILHVYSLWGVTLSQRGLLAKPPQDVITDVKQNFLPGAVEGATISGQVWGYPTEINNYMLVYNKRILDEAGMVVPETWDDLVTQSKRLTVKGPDGRATRAGFAFMDGWNSAVVHPYLALLYGDGGQPFTADLKKSLFDSPEGVNALEKQVRLLREGGADLNVPLGEFTKANVGMVIMAPWWKATLRNTMKDSFQDVAVAPIPAGKAGKATVHYTWFFGVDSASKHQREAWEFLKWLNGKKEKGTTSRMGDFLVKLGSLPSAKVDVQGQTELTDQYTRPFVEAMAYSRAEPNVYRGEDVKNSLWKEITAAWKMQKSPKEAMTAAKRQIDQILGESK